MTHRVEGYWDKADRTASQVEIDLVALDEDSQTIRLGTCKRNGDKLLPDLHRFDRHVHRFLTAMPRFANWTVQRVAIARVLSAEQRTAIQAAGYLSQDLNDLTAGLLVRRETT